MIPGFEFMVFSYLSMLLRNTSGPHEVRTRLALTALAIFNAVCALIIVLVEARDA